MEHIESLPLKYRPMTFEDLVGQEVISKYLSKLIQRGQNAKNIILAGSYGTGKTSSGRIYARALNCLTPTVEGSPCNYCKNCTAHIDKVYTDYKELDGATQGRAENIRTLVELAYTPPMFGRYRILLVDECFSAETLVHLADGTRLPIGKVVNQRLPIEVLSYNETTKQFEAKKVVDWVKNPAPLWTRVKVHSKKNGTQTLRCSANHTHYTDGGFKKSFELTTQDKMLQKEFVLTKEQRSAVAATLLGDGSTSRSPKGSPRLIYRHGESQVDYLNLKRRIWSNLANPIKRNTNSGFTGQSMVSFEVSMIPELSEILDSRLIFSNYSISYAPFNPSHLADFDTLSLFLWIIDNAHAADTNSLVVNIRSRYTEEETAQIAQALSERFNLKAESRSYPAKLSERDNRIYLSFEEVLPLIAEYAEDLPTVQYKLGRRKGFYPSPAKSYPEAHEELVPVEIVSIEHDIQLKDAKYRYNYCLTVEDNHNFFVGTGILTHNCHALSKAAWDSLLKVVEEPPPYLCFIFATTELEKMRPAIISRCQAFEVTLLDHATSVSHLKKICTLENIPHDDDALSLISYVSKGHPRDLLKNLEQCSFYGELNLDNASAILNLGYIKNLREFLRAWQADDLAKMRLEILNWTSSPQEIIWVLQEFFIYVTHMTLKISGAKINPLFTTIPRPEMSAFYSWMEKNVAADIAGGVAEALSNCVEILQRSPATNVLSLEILISSLYQYAYDAKFRIKKFGKHSNVAQTKTEVAEGPVQRVRQRRVIEGSAPPIAGVVPSRINPMNPNQNANQSAQPQQNTQPVAEQQIQSVQQETHVMPQTPSSVSFDDDEVVVNLQTDKVYPHTLQAQGFTTVMEASEAREI